MDGMTKNLYLRLIKTVMESPRNDAQKITMLKDGFMQFVNNMENRVMFQRPENLNPMQEGHEEYNRGWNDCSSHWIEMLHDIKMNDVSIECCEEAKDEN